MAQNLVINGVTYLCPQQGDQNWAGANATDGWMAAVTSGMLQKAGGAFTLTADVNFGASFGLVAPYLKSATANIAATGALRLANADAIAFRNIGNSADQALQPHADGILQYAGIDLVNLSATQTLTNKTMSGSSNTFSNIGYSSLALSASVVNADISASAAIALTKLATIGAGTILGNNGGGSAVPAALTAAQALAVITPLTTKGDLLAFSTLSTRFAVGADGTVLTADSTQTAGLKWTTPLTNPMTTGGDLIYGGASGAATRLANGSAGQVLQSAGGTSAPVWASSATNNASTLLQNLGLAVSVSANAMTIALKQADGSTNPAAAPNDVKIGMRSATATTGGFNLRSATGALSIVIPSGATLGQTSAVNQYVWVYAIDNAGTVELAVSGVTLFPDNSIQSTTAIGAGSTSGSTLYSTSARTNVPIRLIGRLLVNETTAGTWASNATDVVTAPRPVPNIGDMTSYTPTFAGCGTVSAITMFYKREGDTCIISGAFTTGTCTAALASMTLPAGLVIDNTKLSGANNQIIGSATVAANPCVSNTAISAPGTSTTLIYFGIIGSNLPTLPQNGTGVFNNATITEIISIRVPIAGWSAYGP